MALRALTPEEEAVAAGLERHITMLSEVIGVRNLDRPGGLEAAARYIENTLRGWGYEPAPDAFVCMGKEVRNIVVEVKGRRDREKILIVGAHYDSVDCPAANDNGSGVAGVLEVARLLAGKTFGKTVRFVFFVNEEPPFYKSKNMGSLVYARRCRERGDEIVGMINLETIGCYSDAAGSQKYPYPLNKKWFWFLPRRGNFISFVGDFRSWGFTWKVRRLFKRAARFPSLWIAAPAGMEGPGMSDHWCFWREGYRALMVTDTAYFRYDHYHKQTDTVDKIDFPRTGRVVSGIARAVEKLAGR
jgi:Zn-dependent M28 family amino/carboxypeptidase